MWSVGGGVKFIPATFDAKEGVKKGLAKVSSFSAGIPDWDAQFAAEQAQNQGEEEREELTGVQAALVLDQKMALAAKKKLAKKVDPEYPMVDSSSEEEEEEEDREAKKRKHKHKHKRRRRAKSDSSSSSESDSSSGGEGSDTSSSGTSGGSHAEAERAARRRKDKKRKRKERAEREAKKKKKSKSKKSKKEKKDASKSKKAEPVRLSQFLAGDSSGDEDAPRSAISGKKIQMKVKKSAEDKEAERRRQNVLSRLNAHVDADKDE
mmetsp:Transcript_26417/g.50165  ORF Transcript_26417/g.50165 Transcript_26417/m.50165 type:complete len:264 (-) Transcript_26417:179-970(-)|eukprot:CAMPEP_0114237664 /NCGR_PEP_ID=MMETSP0058-20121206/7511_1 /TAXON_ID=36894 /ORGANISM="Pyramimonas parkeae, CCMP726" /LENGTH=263 /DNA_ID=CAMNT_0001349721 /DNA_START=184 /DNA_END=975 /DNA_ORIENTATION=+